MRLMNVSIGAMLCGVLAAGCVVVAGPPGHVKHGRGVVVAPAPIVVASPPRMVFVTEFGISFAPDLDIELYEVGGVWYSLHGGAWYRADAYNGPWVVVERRHLHPRLVKIKPGQVKAHYKTHHPKKVKAKGHGKGRND